jgi:hypothetical protein
MSHYVKCYFCGASFDRDKEEYCLISSRRYAHASCTLREAEKDSKYKNLEVIDPTDNIVCAYCKKPMSKKDSDCVMIGNNKYVHAACKELEEKREKTDQEKLEDYIKKLYKTEYVNPRIRKQIKQYVEEYNYTYSGIQKALFYFYEIKNGDLAKAHDSIGIVPYVYKDAYNYHYNLWLAQQQNQNIDINAYIPKVKEIVIPIPERKVKKRKLFTFLDEEV